MKEYIKLFRLKSGEDIIGFLEASGRTKKRIRFPVCAIIVMDPDEESSHLILKYWLPVQLVTKNQIELPNSEILFITDPKEEFKDYYINFLEAGIVILGPKSKPEESTIPKIVYH